MHQIHAGEWELPQLGTTAFTTGSVLASQQVWWEHPWPGPSARVKFLQQMSLHKHFLTLKTTQKHRHTCLDTSISFWKHKYELFFQVTGEECISVSPVNHTKWLSSSFVSWKVNERENGKHSDNGTTSFSCESASVYIVIILASKQTRKKNSTKTSLWSRKLTSEGEAVVMNIYGTCNENHMQDRTSPI